MLDAVVTETEGVEAEDELRVVVRYGQEGVELTAPRPLTGQEVADLDVEHLRVAVGDEVDLQVASAPDTD